MDLARILIISGSSLFRVGVTEAKILRKLNVPSGLNRIAVLLPIS